MRITAFIVASFFFTTLFSSVLIMAIPYTLLDKLIWVGLSIPVTWTLSMLYCYWDDKAYRPLLVLGTLSLLCGIMVYLLPAPQ